MNFYLNPAVVNFGVSATLHLPAGDARHQWRRRSNLLQAIDNEADSVKLATQQGKKNEKKIVGSAFTKKVKREFLKNLASRSNVQVKIVFSFFEVQDLGSMVLL